VDLRARRDQHVDHARHTEHGGVQKCRTTRDAARVIGGAGFDVGPSVDEHAGNFRIARSLRR
jgi:hypothetical protein